MSLLLLQKLVCTTIRPTQLPYKELYDWDGAAEFVADYLNFVTLEPAHELVCINSAFFLAFHNVRPDRHQDFDFKQNLGFV